MARLHIILGYCALSRDAVPYVIHVGKDADAAKTARDKALLPDSGFASVEHFDGPQGYRKHNPSPGAPYQPSPQSAQDVSDIVAANREMQTLLDELQGKLSEAQAKVTSQEVIQARLEAAEARVTELAGVNERVVELEAKLMTLESEHELQRTNMEAQLLDVTSQRDELQVQLEAATKSAKKK